MIGDNKPLKTAMTLFNANNPFSVEVKALNRVTKTNPKAAMTAPIGLAISALNAVPNP